MPRQAGQTKRPSLSEHLNIKAVIRGIVISYIITIPMFMIFALILSYTNSPEKMIAPAVLTTTIISVLVAGYSVARNLRNKGWVNGGIVGFIYMVILYVFSGLIFKDFTINRYIVTVIFIGILTGAIGGILGINLRRSTYSRVKS